MKRIAAVIEGLSEWSGRLVAWLTLLMVLVTFAIVVLRYGFNLGWVALQESVTYMHALVFMLAAAYTWRHDGHVRVDIFYRRFSPRGRAWVDLLGTLLLLLPMMTALFWLSWDYVASAWSLREGSRESGGLPLVWLLKSLLLALPALLALQGVAQIIRSIRILRGEQPPVPATGSQEV